jgi:beta-lactamase superfamily II metal-dependent hydrolase
VHIEREVLLILGIEKPDFQEGQALLAASPLVELPGASCYHLAMKRFLLVVFLLSALSLVLPAAKTLDMYVVDTEGGKALLIVSPSGQSMLLDTGFPTNNDRDTNRIVEAANVAGVKKLDVLVTTHYDVDHVGNVTSVVAKIPVVTFVDHGPAAVDDERTVASVKAYDALVVKAKHMVVKPGDKIPFAGVDVLVVTSAGVALKTPLQGAGAPNRFCAETKPMTWAEVNEDTSENANAVGLLFTFGKFRMLDLADLTWNKEIALMCPNNPIGSVDLFMVSHHGNDISNSPALVKALNAKVAIMNNGERKIGAAQVIKTIKSAPGMQALYQEHWSANAPYDNPTDEFLANLHDSPDGKYIKVSAEQSGSFTVTNGRTGVSKTYK